MDDDVDNPPATAIVLLDSTLSEMGARLAKNEQLTDEQRSELLAAIMQATGAVIPGA